MRISALVPEHPHGALEFRIEKRRVEEKLRTLAIPSEPLAEIHRQLHEHLRKAGGSKAGLSPVRNAVMHKSSLYFYQTDLKDAFPSVGVKRLAGVLCHTAPDLGSYEEVAAFLEQYCFDTRVPGLPQGSPVSPILFELYCRWYLDRPIQALLLGLRKRGFPYLVYTRYVDDITLSSRGPISKHLRKEIKKILRGAGFAVHSNKTTYLTRDRHDILVTGVRILRGGRLAHSQAFLDSLQQEIDRWRKREPPTEEDVQKLQGLVNYYFELLRVSPTAFEVDSRRGEHAFRMADQGAWILGEFCKKKRLQKRKDLRWDEKRFPKRWLDKLRARIDLPKYVVGELKGLWSVEGKRMETLCPLRACHTGYYKHRKLILYQGEKYFRCTCVQGDIITFAMRRHGWSFTAACVQLAQLAKLELPPEYYRRVGAHRRSKPKQLSMFEPKE